MAVQRPGTFSTVLTGSCAAGNRALGGWPSLLADLGEVSFSESQGPHFSNGWKIPVRPPPRCCAVLTRARISVNLLRTWKHLDKIRQHLPVRRSCLWTQLGLRKVLLGDCADEQLASRVCQKHRSQASPQTF